MRSIARISCAVLFAALVAAPVLAVDKAPSAKKGAPAAKAPAAKPAPTVAPTATPAPKPVLVFFMNPAGRPCQIQDQLLAESKAQWGPLADLRYARTDAESDRELFYRYGVRALPTLLLVDPAGKELKRFPPGIQQPTTVLEGLKASR
jgi:thioredoxin 1